MNSYAIGTAVKFTVVINVDTATSAKITIENPSGSEIIDSVDMTSEADRVYSYVWQSSESNTTHTEGTYTITIDIGYGGYTTRQQSAFTAYDPQLD